MLDDAMSTLCHQDFDRYSNGGRGDNAKSVLTFLLLLFGVFACIAWFAKGSWASIEICTTSDSEVDVYSYSMVLYEAICQAMPFVDVKPQLVCLCVAEGRRPDLSKVPPDTPSYLRETMVSCWAESPQDRPSFADISERLAAEALQLKTSSEH